MKTLLLAVTLLLASAVMSMSISEAVSCESQNCTTCPPCSNPTITNITCTSDTCDCNIRPNTCMRFTISCTGSAAQQSWTCNDGTNPQVKACACKFTSEMDEEECAWFGFAFNSSYTPSCREESENTGCTPDQWGFWNSGLSCQYYFTGCDCLTETPVIIDVAGNGFALTDKAGGVLFDLDGDGTKEQRAWTRGDSDDVLLVLDRNGNGVIDGPNELFGNRTPQPAPPDNVHANGFRALAVLDGNGDGKVDNSDSAFANLRLWQDTNHDGVSQSDELRSLPSAGVTAIETSYKEAKKDDEYGNHFAFRAKVYGSTTSRWAWDVYLR
jgi:hypothetical protein